MWRSGTSPPSSRIWRTSPSPLSPGLSGTRRGSGSPTTPRPTICYTTSTALRGNWPKQSAVVTLHVIEPERCNLHGAFSRDLPPVLTIDSGDTVRYRTLDAGWGLEPHDR